MENPDEPIIVEAKPSHLYWGVGLLLLAAIIFNLTFWLADDTRLALFVGISTVVVFFIVWLGIYRNFSGIEYEIDSQGVRLLRKGVEVREIPRHEIMAFRRSGKHIVLSLRDKDPLELALTERTSEIFQRLSR